MNPQGFGEKSNPRNQADKAKNVSRLIKAAVEGGQREVAIQRINTELARLQTETYPILSSIHQEKEGTAAYQSLKQQLKGKYDAIKALKDLLDTL